MGDMHKKHDMAPLIISIQQVRKSWFRHQDTIYSVTSCTSDQFRAWAWQIAPPTWTDSDARAVLAQPTLDAFDRWFVLVALEKRLMSAGQSLPVFVDAQCEIAFRAKSERVQPDMVQKVVETRSKPVTRERRKKDVHA